MRAKSITNTTIEDLGAERTAARTEIDRFAAITVAWAFEAEPASPKPLHRVLFGGSQGTSGPSDHVAAIPLSSWSALCGPRLTTSPVSVYRFFGGCFAHAVGTIVLSAHPENGTKRQLPENWPSIPKPGRWTLTFPVSKHYGVSRGNPHHRLCGCLIRCAVIPVDRLGWRVTPELLRPPPRRTQPRQSPPPRSRHQTGERRKGVAESRPSSPRHPRR